MSLGFVLIALAVLMTAGTAATAHHIDRQKEHGPMKLIKSGAEYEAKRREGEDHNWNLTAADHVIYGGRVELNYEFPQDDGPLLRVSDRNRL